MDVLSAEAGQTIGVPGRPCGRPAPMPLPMRSGRLFYFIALCAPLAARREPLSAMDSHSFTSLS